MHSVHNDVLNQYVRITALQCVQHRTNLTQYFVMAGYKKSLMNFVWSYNELRCRSSWPVTVRACILHASKPIHIACLSFEKHTVHNDVLNQYMRINHCTAEVVQPCAAQNEFDAVILESLIGQKVPYAICMSWAVKVVDHWLRPAHFLSFSSLALHKGIYVCSRSRTRSDDRWLHKIPDAISTSRHSRSSNNACMHLYQSLDLFTFLDA
jgi:hypothetical protein